MTQLTPSPSAADQPRSIRIDSEHLLVRFLVPVLTLAFVIVAHLAGTVLLARIVEGMNAGCMMLPIDVVLLLIGGSAIERLLKRTLPSRRTAYLTNTALTITDARTTPPANTVINWLDTVHVKAWRFDVPRRSRVPKGWYCMALHLLQNETEIVLYTFMSPEEAEQIIGFRQFVRLRPRKETEANTDLAAVAEQRRLLKLEDIRWRDGAEIEREDFRALLAVLQRRAPGWY